MQTMHLHVCLLLCQLFHLFALSPVQMDGLTMTLLAHHPGRQLLKLHVLLAWILNRSICPRRLVMAVLSETLSSRWYRPLASQIHHTAVRSRCQEILGQTKSKVMIHFWSNQWLHNQQQQFLHTTQSICKLQSQPSVCSVFLSLFEHVSFCEISSATKLVTSQKPLPP